MSDIRLLSQSTLLPLDHLILSISLDSITTQPIVLFLFGVSLIFIRKLIRKNSFVLLLFAWLAIAVLRNSLFGALSYGGVRLIMEYIPALCMLAGIGAGFLINKNKKYILVSSLIIFLAFVPTLSKTC